MGVRFVDYANPETVAAKVLREWDDTDHSDAGAVEGFINQVATELQMLAVINKRNQAQKVNRDTQIVGLETKLHVAENAEIPPSRWWHLKQFLS